jgi:hypothetical protein
MSITKLTIFDQTISDLWLQILDKNTTENKQMSDTSRSSNTLANNFFQDKFLLYVFLDSPTHFISAYSGNGLSLKILAFPKHRLQYSDGKFHCTFIYIFIYSSFNSRVNSLDYTV